VPLAITLSLLMWGVVYQGYNAVFPSYYPELFPTRTRVSAMAISQNIGTFLTAMLPALFATVAAPGSTDVPLKIGALTLVITLISAIAAFSARETYRVHLNDLGDKKRHRSRRTSTTGCGTRRSRRRSSPARPEAEDAAVAYGWRANEGPASRRSPRPVLLILGPASSGRPSAGARRRRRYFALRRAPAYAGPRERHEAYRQHDAARDRAVEALLDEQQLLLAEARLDGMTILPPGLSCSRSGAGTMGAAAVTTMPSKGAFSASLVPVADAHLDVAIGKACEALRDLAPQRFDDLDRIHLLARARRALRPGNPSRFRSPARHDAASDR
jgi:hypothetical protein